MMTKTRLRCLYFLTLAAQSIFSTYYGNYLYGLGYSGHSFGRAQALCSLVAVPSGVVWAAIAARLGGARRTLRICIAASLVAALTIAFAVDEPTVLAAMVLYGLLVAPAGTLLDSSTIESAIESGSVRIGTFFGRTKFFGALGYALSALAMGAVLSYRNDRPADNIILWSFLALTIAGNVATLGISTGARPMPVASGAPSSRAGSLLAAAALLGITMGHNAANQPYARNLALLVEQRGFSAYVTGLGLGVGVAAEASCLLWLYPHLARRYSSRALLLVCLIATAVRWALTAVATHLPLLLGLQLLHGLSMGIYAAVLMQLVVELVPSRWRTLFLSLGGVGSAAGAWLAGTAYDLWGAAPVYSAAAAVELLPCALALTLLSRSTQPSTVPSSASAAASAA
jgi:PPP family 3-phenylpropionic acid transporter